VLVDIPHSRRILVGLTPALSLVLCLFVAPKLFWINYSPSLPYGVYLVDAEAPRKGDLVAVCLPPPIARIGLTKGYLRPGSCLGAMPVLKRFAAQPGDRVLVNSRGTWINGERLPLSAPRILDHTGRPLSSIGFNRTLHHNEVWLYAPHPSSWDSRYFGPVPPNAVLARMTPLLIF
jgi:conjugative transfer signal peptidase TraF